MKASEASKSFFGYHRMNSKKNPIRNYEFLISRFCEQFGDRELKVITPEAILTFLADLTESNKQSTKRLRFFR